MGDRVGMNSFSIFQDIFSILLVLFRQIVPIRDVKLPDAEAMENSWLSGGGVFF